MEASATGGAWGGSIDVRIAGIVQYLCCGCHAIAHRRNQRDVFGIGVDHLRRGAACTFVLFSRKSGINQPGLSFAGGACATCVLCGNGQRAP
jgi:hypothetical protein